MIIYPDLAKAIARVRETLINTGYPVQTEKWQGIPIDEKRKMFEALNISFSAIIPPNTTELEAQVKPNLPWADIHFMERVGGLPLNPGESYKKWPFYGQDEKMRNSGELFSHTYMERFWPKFAGKPWFDNLEENQETINRGVRYSYGDLKDLVNLLLNEPMTRQAFLPVWFPEDTGASHGGRVPCTIGYHFIIRNNQFHMVYYIRSCDYFRHFRDDIYLGIRLLYWIYNELIKKDNHFKKLDMGTFTMHITSLHIFNIELDYLKNGDR